MKIIKPVPVWGDIIIDNDKNMNGRSLYNLNEVRANKISGKIVDYDTDCDGILESDTIPEISRDKITDFFKEPFWPKIPDSPQVYSNSHSTERVTLASNEVKQIASVSGQGFIVLYCKGDGYSSFRVLVTVDENQTDSYYANQKGTYPYVFYESLQISVKNISSSQETDYLPTLKWCGIIY